MKSDVKTQQAKLIDPNAASSLLRAWSWWIGPAVVSFALALLYIDPFVGDWDGLDYTIQSVSGQPSSMALGRTAFIFTNHLLWSVCHSIFQLQAKDAYLLFKGVVVVQSGFAVVACWALAREVVGSLYAATVAAVAVALAPTFVLYSGQVMTEIPSVLVVAIALTIYLRGVRDRRVWIMLVGAGLLGAGVNVRETTAFLAPWLVIAPLAFGWRVKPKEIKIVVSAIATFLVFAFAPFLVWFWSDVGNYRGAWFGWLETMRAQAALHPVSIRNALPFFVYFALTAPLVFIALPFAFFREWRLSKLSPLLGLGAVGLFANLLLFFNYSTAVNWRYFLTGLPALAPIAAVFILSVLTSLLRSKRRAFFSALASLGVVALVTGFALAPLRAKSIEKHTISKNYRTRLAVLPDDAVVIAGEQTVAVIFWRGVGEGHWEVIGTGAGWPGAGFVPLIQSYLKNGQRVYLDAHPSAWSPCSWQRDEITELVKLEAHFRFRRVVDTIIEIRPKADIMAVDDAQLESLLPENRPQDVKDCGGTNRLN